MGESACLMQAFSYAAGIPNEAKEGNPIHALEESFSFGRFTSESLAWEKWSSFSHNRYVEEAEKYSQPGSVAQKKAFFEAYYKNLAAKKAAALLEQANAAATHVPEPAPEPESEGRVLRNSTTSNSQTKISKPQMDVKEQKMVKAPNKREDSTVDVSGCNPNVSKDELDSFKVEGDGQVTKDLALDNSNKVELSDKGGTIYDHHEVSELELSETAQMEKPLLKQSFYSNQEALASVTKKKQALYSTSRASKIPPSPAKPVAATLPWKEDNTTPISRKPAIDSSDKKRSTPRSLYNLINFTSAKGHEKLTSPVARKIESSKLAASSKTLKDCPTPLRTPTTASVNLATKHYSTTPQSENRRTKAAVGSSASGSKTIGSKWRFLSMDYTKSPSANKNKSQSPMLCSPFSLRTEERAARRKQKLEEKFNAKEAQKVQLQTKIKEKAESELKKLRQSLCFKARPLPNFYKAKETPKNEINKIPLMQPQSPKLGRKPSPNKVHSTTSLPPQRPSIKNSGSKHVLEKNRQGPIHSHTSLREMITHENTSPNIQL